MHRRFAEILENQNEPTARGIVIGEKDLRRANSHAIAQVAVKTDFVAPEFHQVRKERRREFPGSRLDEDRPGERAVAPIGTGGGNRRRIPDLQASAIRRARIPVLAPHAADLRPAVRATDRRVQPIGRNFFGCVGKGRTAPRRKPHAHSKESQGLRSDLPPDLDPLSHFHALVDAQRSSSSTLPDMPPLPLVSSPGCRRFRALMIPIHWSPSTTETGRNPVCPLITGNVAPTAFLARAPQLKSTWFWLVKSARPTERRGQVDPETRQ